MNCDPIARVYWLLEYLVFGGALQRRRIEYLDEVKQARRVLILGDGDGRFTAEFCRYSTADAIDSIDSSATMLKLARQRAGSQTRVRFLQGDVRALEFHGPYDLVVSHFFLDCFTDEELGRLLPKITATLAPGALWVISEFRVAGRASAFLIRLMYWFFRLTTGLQVTGLPDYAKAMTSNGLCLISSRTGAGGLLVSDLYWSHLTLSHDSRGQEVVQSLFALGEGGHQKSDPKEGT